MSVLLQSPAVTVPLRKRTSSFSYPLDPPSPSPRPPKSPRMGNSSLRRTDTFLLLPELPSTSPASMSTTTTTAPAPTQGPLPYYRTLAYHKDQRTKRKGMFLNHHRAAAPAQQFAHSPVPIPTPHHAVRHSVTHAQHQQRVAEKASSPIIATPASTSGGLRPLLLSAAASTASSSSSSSSNTCAPPKRTRPAPQLRAPSQVILPSVSSPNPRTTIITNRTSSPLSPTPHAPLLSSLPACPSPPRPRPRGKHEPDLLRTAIKIRMAGTPEGQRILRLGPRLALMDWEMELAAEGMVHKVDVGKLGGILEVTRDLERMVADEEMREREERDGDGDVLMGDATTTVNTTTTIAEPLEPPPAPASAPRVRLPLKRTTSMVMLPPMAMPPIAMPVLTASWVVVKAEADWEMVDCAA